MMTPLSFCTRNVWKEEKKYVPLTAQKETTMKNNNSSKRTREEIIAWWKQARERKEAFQRETNEWWQARQKGLKDAEESGYYNIELV